MLPFLDPNDPLGVDRKRKGVATLYEVLLNLGALCHPRCVPICRNGEFYEAFGYAAVLLVELCGLQPMGSNAFRAGFPLQNVESSLRRLTDAGLSVVVIEQVPPARVFGGARKSRLERIVGGVVTPSSPTYTWGQRGSADACPSWQPRSPPTLGVAYERGWVVVEAYADEARFIVHPSCTEQAAVDRLHASGMADVHVHASVGELAGARQRGQRGWAVLNALRSRGRGGADLPRYGGDIVNGLLDALRASAGLKPGFEFARAPPEVGAPPALPLSAAHALGLDHAPGVPDLVDALLPRGAPAVCREALRSTLLTPPGEAAARGLAAALAALLAPAAPPLPRPPMLLASCVSRMVRDREASAPLLWDAAAVAGFAQAALTQPALRSIAEPLLAIATRGAPQAGAGEVAAACGEAVLLIRDVLQPRGAGGGEGAPSAEAAARDARPPSALLGERMGDEEADAVAWPCGDAPPALPHGALPAEALDSQRTWRGRVRRTLLEPYYAAVDAAAAALDVACAAELKPHGVVVWKADEGGAFVKPHPATAAAATGLGTPKGRKKKEMSGLYSARNAEVTSFAYLNACDAAREAVLGELGALAHSLRPHLPALAAACSLAVWVRTAEEHATEAQRRGWCLPLLGPVGGEFELRGLTPWWLPRRGSAAATPNDVSLPGCTLLTGANAAGKSTLCRSLAAAALLANTGLAVPAASARVPRLVSLHCRLAGGDSPSDGLSHWAADAADAAAALQAVHDYGAAAMVVLDELGAGTEAAHSAAVAGAVVAALDASGARCVFSTHLHAVLRLPLPLGRTDRMAMLRDYCLVAGECTDSNALDVAAAAGVPPAVLGHARDLLPHAEALAGVRPREGLEAAPGPPAGPATAWPVQPPAPVRPLAARLAGAPPATFSLDDAVKLLQQSRLPVRHLDAVDDLLRLRSDEVPPPACVGHAFVYAARWPGGEWYVGETADLMGRWARHVTTHGGQAGGAEVVAARVANKSAARRLEADLIKALEMLCVPLSSNADGRHSNFGDRDVQ